MVNMWVKIKYMVHGCYGIEILVFVFFSEIFQSAFEEVLPTRKGGSNFPLWLVVLCGI